MLMKPRLEYILVAGIEYIEYTYFIFYVFINLLILMADIILLFIFLYDTFSVLCRTAFIMFDI